jgi:sugar phosphate isomerase/epimerase
MKKRKLSVSEVTTKDWTFEEDVRHYAALGFDGIGVWFDVDGLSPKLAACGLERGIEILEKYRLPVASLVARFGAYTSRDSAAREAAIADGIQDIRVAERLGTDCVIVTIGVPYGRAGRTVAQMDEIAATVLRRLAPLAQEHGVRLAIEPLHPMYSDYLNTMSDAMRLLELVDQPSVGLLLDVYHVWQEENLLDKISQVGDKIFTVHISDWREPPRSLNDRMVPGEGIIAWKPILHAIEATGYQGYYDVEIFSQELWQSDYVDVLRRCQEGFAAAWI